MAKTQVRVEAIIRRQSLGDKFDKTRKELIKYMRTTGANKIARELDKSTEGWSERPKFKGTVTQLYAQTRVRLNVTPTGRGSTNWIRVNNGTGPRYLVSKKGLMSFPSQYKPKTKPGGIYNGPGVKYGKMVWKRRVVYHEITPRKFTEVALDAVDSELKRDINNIIQRNL